MSNVAGYDLIGDIHGHADELLRLLIKLGYTKEDGVFRHSERQAIFLGDFIDRGPKIREVLETVFPMVQAGFARAVLGNHEFNALAFHTFINGVEEQSLRPRTLKNIRQHAATIQQLTDSQLSNALDWFRTLPLWLEVLGPDDSRCRAVHACWDDIQIAQVMQMEEKYGGVNKEFLVAAMDKEDPLFSAVEVLLKGKELPLPEGFFYTDKDGHERNAIRARWFEMPTRGMLYQDYVLQADPIDCPIEIDLALCDGISAYPFESAPVFVGHYWLRADRPRRLATNVACLDYSVARSGFLCAYSWDGETQIDESKFRWAA
ncbi:MAG: metallophosphoesterase [Planctomycetales bacterium]|nr:metallophosphoesterase [Planctomycetales bacterium]